MNDFTRSLARIAPTLATLVLLVLGGFVAARWVAYFAAPSESAAPPARERPQLGAAAQTLAGAHLFGIAAAGETVSNLNIKLRGVFAGGGTETGFAIVNAGGRDQATRIGGEVVPGVTLEAVHPGHVVLRRAGALERVNLEERVSGKGPSASLPRYAQATPPAPTSPSAPPTGAAPPAPQSSTPGARFRRPEPYAPVGDVPTEPASPGPASAPAPAPKPPAPRPLQGAASNGLSQGLVIQDVPPGSMLERLGLQPGDVVRSVNGEAVTSEADVARVLQQRGMQGSFTAEVQRGGMTVPIAVSGLR
jgi:general secretion pathway protein C